MSKVYVAVGSTRRPKLNAVWEALSVFGPYLDPNAEFEVVGVEVPSGVGHTPLSRAELMAGARRRADALLAQAREHNEPWRYFVGLEGGLDVVEESLPAQGVAASAATSAESEWTGLQPLKKQEARRLVFLENWAYVTDGTRASYGQSGAILLPEALAVRVVDHGEDLAAAIDAFAGEQGIRDARGAWGVLTNNLITRQDAFRVAVINAFAPFFNAGAYRRR